MSSFDKLPTEIIKDSELPPDVVLLRGWIAESTVQGHMRVYLNAECSDYVEIPGTAVLKTQPIPAESSNGLGGSHVWVKRDARVIIHSVRRAQAEFLTGEITGNLQRAGRIAFPPTPCFAPEMYSGRGVVCYTGRTPYGEILCW